MNEDQIIELAIQGHASTRDAIWWAIQQEREACAKVAEFYEPRCDSCPRGVVIAIRSRGIDAARVAEVGIWGEI